MTATSCENRELFTYVQQPDGSLVRQLVNSASVQMVTSGFRAGSMPGACEVTTIAILVSRPASSGTSRAVALVRTRVGDVVKATQLLLE